MKTTKKMQRLHLDKNTTRYRKMSGGSNKSGNTPKPRGSSVKNFFGSIGKRFGSKKKNTSIEPQPLINRQKSALDKLAVNKFPKTSKFFRGVGKKFGLSKEKPKQRLIGAVDELVEEIGKYNDKTRNYAQYDITDNEYTNMKKQITDALDPNKTNVNKPSIDQPVISTRIGQAVGADLVRHPIRRQVYHPNPVTRMAGLHGAAGISSGLFSIFG